MSQRSAHLGSRIVRGMFVLIFFGLFLKLGGLFMALIVARYYGIKGVGGDVTTAYLQVYTIVIYVGVYSSILKFVMPAFMPVFAGIRTNHGETEAWRLANTMLNGVILLGLALAAGAFFFSDAIIQVLVPGFTGERHRIAAAMLHGMSPGILALAFAVMAMALFNSYKVFSFPALGEAAQKLTWALGLFLLIYLFKMNEGASPERPIAIAFLIGCVVQAAILAFGLRDKCGLYTVGLPALGRKRRAVEFSVAAGFLLLLALWVWAVRSPGRWLSADAARSVRDNSGFIILTGAIVLAWTYAMALWLRARSRGAVMGRVAVLIAPLLIGILFARYRDFVQAYFQSYTKGPAFASIELAKKIVNLPTILVAYSVSIAMLPYLCDLAAQRDRKSFALIFSRAVRMIALFFVPLTIVLAICGRSVMRLCFDPGNWSPADADQAGIAIALYASALFFYAVENVLMQAFFSLQRVVAPTFIGMALSLAQVGALFLLIRGLGYDKPNQIFYIVLIAFPVTRALKNFILMLILRIRLRDGAPRGGALFLLRLAILTLVVGGATWGAQRITARFVNPDRYAAPRVMLDTRKPQDAAAPQDKTALDRPVRRIPFEISKFILAAVPALAATAVFLIACFLLRIEEFRIILNWLRERGWKKTKEDAPPDAPEEPSP